ncbi:Zn(II)2Cys6 transcription factor, partial [Candidatus Bathyarchaeota archaeon]|nr:Zn(II)2Cys6 transcription factor [Candidatus Bathyarchaeota archaeon]
MGKPRRLRGLRACHACRGQKVRCSGSMPSCSRCKRRGHTCSYPVLKRPIKVPDADESAPEESLRSSATPPGEGRRESTPVRTALEPARIAITDAMLALVDTFFEAIYPLPSYAFLHPET